MRRIFISYAREDRTAAERLANVLESQGWTVWWDRTIPAGRSFDDVIEEALHAAECVLVLWSTASIKSQWVNAEAQEGVDRNILIPVLLEDGVRIPLGFRRLQAASLMGWDGTTQDPSFQRLSQDISRLLGTPPVGSASVQKPDPGVLRSPDPETQHQPTHRHQISRRPLTKAILVALVILLVPFGLIGFKWAKGFRYERKLRHELKRIQIAQERHHRQYGNYTHLLVDSSSSDSTTQYATLVVGLGLTFTDPGVTVDVWAVDSAWNAVVRGDWRHGSASYRRGCALFVGQQGFEVVEALKENEISCFPLNGDGEFLWSPGP